jgi:hypothetical protein
MEIIRDHASRLYIENLHYFFQRSKLRLKEEKCRFEARHRNHHMQSFEDDIKGKVLQ